MSRVKLLSILAVALVAICMTPAARADFRSIDLTQCNTGFCDASGGTSGTTIFATVTKTLVDSTGASISGPGYILVTVTPNAAVYTHTVDIVNDGFGFNSLLTGITLFNPTLPTGYTFQNLTSTHCTGAAGSLFGNRFDGFGCFVYQIDAPQPGSTDATASSLTFTLQNGGGTFTTVDAIDVANSDGHQFALDMIVNDCAASACTGYVSDGGPPSVPEPTSIAFFGTGLLGVGLVLRRKFASKR